MSTTSPDYLADLAAGLPDHAEYPLADFLADLRLLVSLGGGNALRRVLADAGHAEAPAP